MPVLFALIPLLPLLACLVLAVVGRRLGEASHRIAIPAIASSFVLSIVAFVDVLRTGPRTIDLYRMFEAGSLVVDLGLFVDQLAILLLLLVTGVSAIVHVYASRYMIGDPRYPRFFAVTSLFTGAMVTLVMSRNLLMTYMCWEAMGICSYLLISHWAHRPAAGRAAMKAFLVNAVADLGLGCAVLLTFQTFGTLDIPTILGRAESTVSTVNVLRWAGFDFAVPATTVIPLLLFVGAMGKSVQVPLHVWLPFAMEAPTPVSALIHAATMVNAGPFLLVRFSPMLVLAPPAMIVIAVVGAATALFAALVSMTQTDIKKILAYSTMSHIGFMVMTCGVGAFAAAIFHLLAHGFLKAFLFLSSGNSLAAAGHSAHAAHAARTGPEFRSLAWGSLLFACIPPVILFSGPYEEMWTLTGVPAARWTFWIVTLASVFVAAQYVFKLVARSFSETLPLGTSMVRPSLFSPPHSLIVLAGALVVAGFFYGFPSWFGGFIAPAVAHATQPQAEPVGTAGLPVGLLLPLLAALSGWAFAFALYRRPTAVAAEARLHGLYVLFWNKLYFDEIYDAFVVRPTLRVASGLARWIERGLVDRGLDLVVSVSAHTALWLWRVLEGRGLDRAVGSTATASMVAARWLWRALEGRAIQGSVDRLSHQADAVGRFLQTRELHTLQEHLLLIVSGLAGLLLLFYLAIQRG
jgi:NADH-quinone oxidoreductase subunit L